MKKLYSSVLLLLAVLSGAARAQSLTVGCSSPPPAYGVVWTAGQWITCLSSLQAQLGYTPLNVAGGSMSGQLFLAPSVTTNAPLNFPPGVAPTSPANGDLWFASSGLYYRAGGVSIGPLASTSSPTFSSPTFTGTATFPDGTTWTSSAITQGTATWTAFTAGSGVFGSATDARLNIVRSSSSAVSLYADGSSTNIGYGVYSKGTGSVSFYTGTTSGVAGAVEQVRITNTASAARYITMTGSAAGAPAINTSAGTLQLGSAATASLNILGGGTNQITVAGGTVPAVNTSAGNITIGSVGGTTIHSDATINFSNAGFSNCASLGTAVGGNLTCGGAPAGYITYNDNVTSNTLAVSGNLYCMNTGSAVLTLTLPASPGNGAYVAFSDCGGNFAVHSLIIAGNSSNIMYNAGNMTVSTQYAGAVLRYSTGKTSWILQPL